MSSNQSDEEAKKNFCKTLLISLGDKRDPTEFLKTCENYLKTSEGLETSDSEIKHIIQAAATLLKIWIKIKYEDGTSDPPYKPQICLKEWKNFREVIKLLDWIHECSSYQTNDVQDASNRLRIPITCDIACEPDPMEIVMENIEATPDEEKLLLVLKHLQKEYPQKSLNQLKNECLQHLSNEGDELLKVFQAAANFRRSTIVLKDKDGKNLNTIQPTTYKHDDISLVTNDYRIFSNTCDIPESAPEENDNKKSQGYTIAKFIAKVLSTGVLLLAVGLGAITTKSTMLVLANAYTQDYSLSTCPTIVENGKIHYNYTRYTVMLILMTCLCMPDLLAFFYALQRILKTKEDPIFHNKLTVFLGAIPEVLHATGLTFLVLKVFPNVDSAIASMTFALVAVLGSFRKWNPAKNDPGEKPRNENKRSTLIVIVSMVPLLIGYGLTTYMTAQNSGAGTTVCGFLCPLLISFRYAGNFIRVPVALEKVKKLSTYKSTALYTLIRLAFIVGLCFAIHYGIDGNGAIITYSRHEEVRFIEGTRLTRKCSRIQTAFINAGIVNVVSSFLTFFLGFIACQAKVQNLALNLPTVLAYATMVVLTSVFSMASNGETLMDFFNLSARYREVNNYIGWRTVHKDFWGSKNLSLYIIGVFFSLVGFIIATWYVWKGNKDARARVEKLFTKPVYPIISEEILLNRKVEREDTDVKNTNVAADRQNSGSPSYIYICLTIYHESKEEMQTILGSIMRLIKHDDKNKDNFDFETHIWVDDAIIENKNDDDIRLLVNDYVKTLLEEIVKAAWSVEKSFERSNGKVSITPYGARYEFTLPHNKKLYAHLKDTRKVKQKKRWSQCMYLYYILKHKSLSQTGKDTYILALDGDVDFQPDAVNFVLKVMQKQIKNKVGAVCGRIHPLGGGAVYWFQKFEYAVGHWLQKTAEDVLGCVLCSPGCFSLFPTDALKLKSVAGTYIRESTEGKHKIQYDQGEDRWLCTLLLKSGRRIEYAANSDAYTNAPTDFAEFFKQRRRWAPSTMANILDILLDSKTARKMNDDITVGYIVYQWALMAASLLGPSTVVLVIQGALQYVFGMNAIGALMLAVIPVVIYVIICYTAPDGIQINVAFVLTLVYAVIMMVVLVGVIGQMVQYILNPSSVFLLFMIGLFLVTGILHPGEIGCLVHGIMYYLWVPSAFIFLPIYCYCNMHIVSWGTRDGGEKKEDGNKGKKEAQQRSQKIGWRLPAVFRCLSCVNPPPPTEEEEPLISVNNKDAENSGEGGKRTPKTDRDQKANDQKEIDLNQEVLSHGKCIDPEELQFWNIIIKKYLSPNPNVNKMKIDKELRRLRNVMSGAYLFINGLWLTLTFSLAMIIDDANISYNDKYGNEVVLNPLSFLFLIFFLVILLIQFGAMLFHRLDTFIHLMAATSWDPCKNDSHGSNQESNESNSNRSDQNTSCQGRSGNQIQASGQDNTIEMDIINSAATPYDPCNNDSNGSTQDSNQSDSIEMATIPTTSAGPSQRNHLRRKNKVGPSANEEPCTSSKSVQQNPLFKTRTSCSYLNEGTRKYSHRRASVG